ncbi:hypothetical protein QFC20_004189 [Naganishia adeliensis]|uniref:Uncharacterized protein n=1 Tax=Naganishia adeliensis TaxID=92952 RepID=A0ACC2W3T2_9TREE|nr:hypothetical protein QFC20_004189 [Naganishia adeliensis]
MRFTPRYLVNDDSDPFANCKVSVKEYLEYQSRAQQAATQAVQTAASNYADSLTGAPTASQPDEAMEQPSAAYPLECLIYLQNLPDNTNKTELKSLLDVYLEGDKVDYVDWKKGQISAYVRVVRPAHARMIIEGLDNNGTKGSLKAQLLKGEQEEIYWMKLPDKIRMAALQAQS